MTAAHDFECYHTGWSDLPRHAYVCLGPGAFYSHDLGHGASVCLNNFLLEQREDGELHPFDFTQATGDHKFLHALIAIFGFSSDKELLSFLIHGVRWKIGFLKQIRMGHNVFSLKSRARGVGESTAKLIKQGLYVAVPLFAEGETLTADGACPLFFTPQQAVGMGGADKAGKPEEKRPCTNCSDPHGEVNERNSPHGPADGPRAVAFNNLFGPRRIPADYDGPPLPFPDPEDKPTTRDVYRANQVVGSMAAVNGTYAVASEDDVRWMFFQLYTEPCEYYLSIQYLVIGVCKHCGEFYVICVCALRAADGSSEVLFLFRIKPKVMNMGARPSSKIAVRFAKEFNFAWTERVADYVASIWLPKQSEALRRLLATREHTLGFAHAHPFWTCEYTDNFYQVFADATLAAHGTRTRREMAAEMNLWMAKSSTAGTCVPYIGALHVLSGHFGTVEPHKRVRGIATNTEALADALNRDDFVAHNSFIVHLVDALGIDRSLIQGNWIPSNRVRLGTAIIQLSHPANAVAQANYASLVELFATRPAAPFMIAIDDAPSNGPDRPITLFVRMSSDCRADGSSCVICGAALEFEYIVDLGALDPMWLQRHITVGESSGAAVNVAVFGLLLPALELIQEGDNTTERTMLLGSARTPDQVAISQLMAPQS